MPVSSILLQLVVADKVSRKPISRNVVCDIVNIFSWTFQRIYKTIPITRLSVLASAAFSQTCGPVIGFV